MLKLCPGGFNAMSQFKPDGIEDVLSEGPVTLFSLNTNS